MQIAKLISNIDEFFLCYDIKIIVVALIYIHFENKKTNVVGNKKVTWKIVKFNFNIWLVLVSVQQGTADYAYVKWLTISKSK